VDSAVSSSAINWNTIILAIISLLGTLVTSVMAYFVAKIRTTSNETKEAAVKSATSMEQIHVAVNSERTALLKKVEDLRDEILQMSKDKATADEATRARTERKTAEAADRAADVRAEERAARPPAKP